MTQLDVDLRASVKLIIDEVGKVMSVVRKTRAYDPNTDATTVGTPVTYTVKGSPPAPVSVRELGKRDATPDRMDLLPTDSVIWFAEENAVIDIQEFDEIHFDGLKFFVVQKNVYYSGELICAREVFVRGLT
jgi:hypothetical protein